MSRMAIAIVCIVLFVLAWGFQFLGEVLRPPDAALVPLGRELVGAVRIYGFAAVIPVVVWMFGRFRPGKAMVPLIIWGGLVVVLGSISVTGAMLRSGDLKLSTLLPAGVTQTAKFKENYLSSARKSCIDQASKSLAQSGTFSSQQIETYCGCFASGSVEEISDDDVAYMTDHLGSFPPGLTERMKPIATACVKAAMGKSG